MVQTTLPSNLTGWIYLGQLSHSMTCSPVSCQRYDRAVLLTAVSSKPLNNSRAASSDGTDSVSSVVGLPFQWCGLFLIKEDIVSAILVLACATLYCGTALARGGAGRNGKRLLAFKAELVGKPGIGTPVGSNASSSSSPSPPSPPLTFPDPPLPDSRSETTDRSRFTNSSLERDSKSCGTCVVDTFRLKWKIE